MTWADVADKGITATAGLIGVVIGYFGQIKTTKAAHDRDEAGRRADRTIRLTDHQRAIVEELQVGLNELLEASFSYAWSGEDGPTDENAARLFTARATVARLKTLVADQVARDQVKIAVAKLLDVTEAASPTRQMAHGGYDALEAALEALGAALLTLMAEPPPPAA